MAVTRRGLAAIGAGATVVVGGSLAAAFRLGKPEAGTPAGPVIHTLVDPAPEPRLLGIDRLVEAASPAPPAAAMFTDATGGAHRLADFAGEGLVVNMWATWCMPCVAELPALAELAARLSGKGVGVLPLSSDHGGAEAVRAYFAAHGIVGLSVWLDPGGQAARAWGARGIPTTLLVDREGRERARLEGGADWASEAAIARVLALIG